MKIALKKSFLILWWFFATALLLEGGLRIAGYSLNKKAAPVAISSKTLKILCLGESTTAWGGIDAYPSVLQQELNIIHGEGKFAVVNAGVPGASTSMLAAELPELLDRHSPDYVITMMGINDLWSLNLQPGVFDSLKIYKLFRMTLYNLKRYPPRKTESSMDYFWAQKSFSELNASELIDLRQRFEAGDRDISSIFRLSDHYEKKGDSKNQAEVLKAGLNLGVDTVVMAAWVRYIQLLIEQKQFEEAREYLGIAARKFAGNPHFSNLEVFLLKSSGQGYSHLVAYTPENFDEYPPTEKNYLEINRLISSSGATHVVMQYPRYKIDHLKQLLQNSSAAIFVENNQNFLTQLKELPATALFTDQFAGRFGHFNRISSKLVTDNIISTLGASIGTKLAERETP